MANPYPLESDAWWDEEDRKHDAIVFYIEECVEKEKKKIKKAVKFIKRHAKYNVLFQKPNIIQMLLTQAKVQMEIQKNYNLEKRIKAYYDKKDYIIPEDTESYCKPYMDLVSHNIKCYELFVDRWCEVDENDTDEDQIMVMHTIVNSVCEVCDIIMKPMSFLELQNEDLIENMIFDVLVCIRNIPGITINYVIIMIKYEIKILEQNYGKCICTEILEILAKGILTMRIDNINGNDFLVYCATPPG